MSDTGEIIDPAVLQNLRARDQEVFRRRLNGESPRAIAEALGLDTAAVAASERRMTVAISPSFREDLVKLELSRLDELNAGFFRDACSGDAVAAGVVLKVMERRAKMCGLDAPTATQTRVLVETEKQMPPDPIGVDAMLKTLERIAAEGKERRAREAKEAGSTLPPGWRDDPDPESAGEQEPAGADQNGRTNPPPCPSNATHEAADPARAAEDQAPQHERVRFASERDPDRDPPPRSAPGEPLTGELLPPGTDDEVSPLWSDAPVVGGVRQAPVWHPKRGTGDTSQD